MASAHRAGLAHLRLEPDTVVLADNGQVKVVDLAVDRVLRGTSADDVARADAEGIGRVLYACLTARWPDGPHHGLSAAPTQDGRLCSPRQVLAGVPGPLDEVCDRILGDPPRAGRAPLVTPAEIEEALDYVAGRPTRRRALVLPAARHPRSSTTRVGRLDRDLAPTGHTAGTSGRAGPPTRAGARIVGGLVAAVLLAGALLIGYQLAVNAFGDDDPTPTAPPTSETTTTAPPAAVLDIVARHVVRPRVHRRQRRGERGARRQRDRRRPGRPRGRR